MKKSGISLVVLVITIIIMIIIAGVVVVGLSNNNPIDIASESVFKTDLGIYKEELNTVIIKEKKKNKDLKIEDINEFTNAGIRSYINSFNLKYDGKLIIQEGEIVYCGTSNKEKTWAEEVGVFPKK